MRLPHFLIVGAMKAGTTTLYRDLVRHPDIFMPAQKEPETLVRFGEDAAAMREDYASLFRPAGLGDILGEASTAYTKRPSHEGVAARARALCGPELKIVYIRRDAMERSVSHYAHERQLGTISETFGEALRAHPRLIDYSRYDWQIAPWIEAFGPENVLQFDLEAYSRDRRAGLARILEFVGADPARLPPVEIEGAYNRRDEQKTIGNPWLRGLIYSDVYQRGLKRLIPFRLRETVRHLLLPKPDSGDETDADSLRYLQEQLASPAPGTDQAENA